MRRKKMRKFEPKKSPNTILQKTMPRKTKFKNSGEQKNT